MIQVDFYIGLWPSPAMDGPVAVIRNETIGPVRAIFFYGVTWPIDSSDMLATHCLSKPCSDSLLLNAAQVHVFFFPLRAAHERMCCLKS